MPDLEPSTVREITALMIGRLGDLLVASPFLRSLKGLYPRARLRLVVSAVAVEAARLLPEVDETLEFHKLRSFLANAGLARGLARGRCDLMVDLNPAFSRTAALLGAAVRAPVKLGFRKGRLDGVFTHLVEAPSEGEHMLDRYKRLALAVGAPFDPTPHLRLSPSDLDQASQLLNLHSGSKRIRVLIHAGNFKKFDNRWPEEKFVALTDRLLDDPALELFYLAGPGEEAPVRAIVEKLKKPVPVLGPLSVGRAAALLSKIDCALLNITGTTHLAWAVGAPTFGLYSGYTGAVWRLRGPEHGGIVANDWESCRSIGVDDSYRAFRAHLATLKK